MTPWPEWAVHHWVWENESTEESAIALVDDYLARDIPVGAINLDSPLYEEAAAAGYFTQVDAVSGPGIVDWWKGDGSLIDYFNPDAVQWWHEQMDKAIELGIDGWKSDGIDTHIIQAPYSPGLGREAGRNEYGYAYYRDSFDYLREKLGDDRIITARPVDNPGSDIGGFRTDNDAYPVLGRPKDAFIRWAQLGAFSPVMENGGIAWENGTSLTTYLTHADYTYLLGPDVFVAPMLDEGTWRTLTFPEGRWVYLFDARKTFDGETEVTLEIPISEFPAFVREGSDIAATLLANR